MSCVSHGYCGRARRTSSFGTLTQIPNSMPGFGIFGSLFRFLLRRLITIANCSGIYD
jgi:hypothetical protein